MSGSGIVIPDLLGIASMKPIILSDTGSFGSTGYNYIRLPSVPRGKVHYITAVNVFYWTGDVLEFYIEIEDESDARIGGLKRTRNVTKYETTEVIVPFFVTEGNKLAVRINVSTATCDCRLTAFGVELTYTGEM